MYVYNYFGPQSRINFVYFLFIASVLTNDIFKVKFTKVLKIVFIHIIYKSVIRKHLEKGRWTNVKYF